jgi:hypothetical protein
MDAAKTSIDMGLQSMSSFNQAGQYKSQADAAIRSIKDVDMQAAQLSEARAQALSSAIGTIEGRRAASGLSLDSPTAMAIERQIAQSSQRAGQVTNASASQERVALYQKARGLRTAANQSETLGFIQGGISAGFGLSSLFGK